MSERSNVTQKEIVDWMRAKVNTDGFNTAADLAREFLEDRNISHAYDPDFSKAIDASFEIAKEVYGL